MGAKRGTPATPAAREAGRKNLAKGRAAKQAQRDKAAEQGQTMKASERWAMLISGTLSVKDLDNQEVRRMKVRGADGGFSGRRRAIPSHLVHQFQAEQLRRFQDRMRKGLDLSLDVIVDILKDPDAKHTDRLRAADMLQNRVLGKAPETVRIEGVSEFDKMMTAAVGLDRDDLDDEMAQLTRDQA